MLKAQIGPRNGAQIGPRNGSQICTWMHLDALGCTWMHLDAHGAQFAIKNVLLPHVHQICICTCISIAVLAADALAGTSTGLA